MPPPPPGVFGRMPLRPPLRVFGPPTPPPPPFFRGPGAMRSRPLFRPPKFSPYPMGGKVKNGNLATPAAAAVTKKAAAAAAAADGTNPSTAAASNGNGQATVTANGTEGAESSSSNGGSALPTTNSAGSKDGMAAAVEAAKRDGIPVDMIQALYCKLCDAKLNGSLQATAHYVGKSHAKKVKQYQHCQGRTAQQRPSPATNGNKPAAESTKRPIPDTLEKFCKLCDVAFTSEIQAKQHYDGRNHQRRMRGEPPLPKGFYNPVTGRWQRQPPPGMAVKGVSTPQLQQQQLRKPGGAGGAFFCEPCHTSMTSQQQLDSHLQGAKHKARVGGLASAVTAQVVTANVAAAAAAAAATAASTPSSSPQLPQPYVALVPGPTMARVAPCGTC